MDNYFLRLTQINGDKIIVSLNDIVYIEEKSLSECTKICIGRGENIIGIDIKESIDEFETLLKYRSNFISK